MTQETGLIERTQPFMAYLERWYTELASSDFYTIIGDAPEHVALFSVDMINGFCTTGPLASPRVQALAAPIAELFTRAHGLGVRAFVLTQDTHDPNTPEFQAYPPHCIVGSAESQTVAEIALLPFMDSIITIPKNSLSSHLNTTLNAWMVEHPQLSTFIIVGNCTDLCVYSVAMHLRLEANARNIQRRVIVPAQLVNTFDTPVSVAQQLGIMAHDGDLHHVLFLHHMAQNGVEVVGTLV
jgi:nicotinamidase-related amidase